MHVIFIVGCHGITMVTCTEECGNLRWEIHHEEIVVTACVVPALKNITTNQETVDTRRDITCYLGNVEERHNFRGVSTNLFNEASHVTAFCVGGSSLHLLVTQAQLKCVLCSG